MKVEDYAKELLEASGVSDADQKKALEAFLGNEKVKTRLANTLSDIEAERGRVTAEKKRADEVTSKALAAEQENMKIFANNKAVVEQAQKQVQAYVDRYGVLPDGGNPNNPSAATQAVQDVIDKKALEAELLKRDGLTIGLVKAAATITARHLKTFNEEPDFEAIEKIAQERGLTAMKAYDEWAKPKVDAREQERIQKEKEDYAEAKLVEDRSKRGAARVADTPQQNGFMANLSKQLKDSHPSNARESFLSGWREPDPTAALKASK